MPYNAVIKTENITEDQVVDLTHPPVIVGCTFAAGSDVFEAGTIVAKDANGAYVAYDASASDTTKTPVGVLDEKIDTAKQTVARVLLHGTVIRDRVVTAAGAATQEDIDALATAGVYAL